jgi:hypothetical protein
VKAGGRGLLNRYGNSFQKALHKCFPEHSLHSWQFAFVHKNFWKEWDNVVRFVKWVEEKLGIKSPDEWAYITTREICRLGGWTLLKSYSIEEIINKVYGDKKLNWDIPYMDTLEKTQHYLHKQLCEIFDEPKVLQAISEKTTENKPQLLLPAQNSG